MTKIIAILLLALPGFASARLVRVFYRPDGRVIILTPNCDPAENQAACLARAAARDCPRNAQNACLPSDDVNEASLPSRATRNKWRGSRAQGITVDAGVVTKAEQIAEAETALDAELARPSPDAVVAARLQRALERARRSPNDNE